MELQLYFFKKKAKGCFKFANGVGCGTKGKTFCEG